MPDLQGLAHFPGIQQVVEASFSFAHGISPSVATLVIAPQPNPLPIHGTLKFTFGNVSLSWPDCCIDDGSLHWDSSGQRWVLQLFDRRWKWRWGKISGHYNLYEESGKIKDGTEKTPQELAELCLEAIGEDDADVGDLPNDARPTMEWETEVPMEVLARLCDSLGCRVVLQLNNQVKLCKVGEGEQLPDGFIMEDAATLDPPEKPKKVEIVCGPSRYQKDLELEAVGVETDGKILPFEELSYQPADGWGSTYPGYFDEVTSETSRELAKGSVFRMYRVKFPIVVTGEITVKDIYHLVLEAEQVSTISEKDEQGEIILRNKPAEIRGTWCPDEDDEENTAPNTPYSRHYGDHRTYGFSLDAARGLVTFAEPVFRNIGDAELMPFPADLKLRTAFSVREEDTLALKRYAKERQIGDKDTPTRSDRHDELALGYVNGVATNQKEIDQWCEKFLDGIKAEYQTTMPWTRKYAGLREIDLDGAVQTVSWNVGGSGATTVASRGTEQLSRVQPYRVRRQAEMARQITRQAGFALGNAIARLTSKVATWLGVG